MARRTPGSGRPSTRPEPASGAPERAARSRHASKLSAIGARVATIAHELNSPASLIAGSLDNLEEYVNALSRRLAIKEQGRATLAEASSPDTEELAYLLSNATALFSICREGAGRVVRLVDQLRRFSQRAGHAASSAVDANPVMREALAWASHGRTELPEVVVELAPLLPRVVANQDDLRDALANLIRNSFDALAARELPTLWLSSCLVPNDDAAGTTGARVELVVRDNGVGIPEALRERVFEPFFTTKGRGAGLGVGLSIARETIELCGGSIDLRPTTDRGAAFVVRLRAALAGPARPPARPPAHLPTRL